MIEDIGTKRVLILLLLIVVNVTLFVSLGSYFKPEIKGAKNRLSVLKEQASQQLQDLEQARLEIDQLDQTIETFNALKDEGFLDDQDRRNASDLLQRIEKITNMVSARAQIQSAIFEDDIHAAKAGHRIMASPIKLELQALDDVDIYRYLYFVENSLPGHVSIDKFSMKREGDVTAELLRAISSGSAPALVSAELTMIWRTMLPTSDDEKENEDGYTP
jgi:hypothetical protein